MPMRECGATRVEGGMYAEVATSPNGMPLEFFLFDPPQPVRLADLGITPLGTHILQGSDGAYHIFDVIGEQYYPYPLDWYMEAKHYGISRRLNPMLDYSLLTRDSRLITLHARAYVNNADDYLAGLTPWKPDDWACVKGLRAHEGSAYPDPMCIRLWWFDFEQDDRTFFNGPGQRCGAPALSRKMATFDYTCYQRPGTVSPDYQMAIFGSFPLGRIVVIKDPKGNKHVERAKKAARGQVPVEVVDE